MTITANKIEDLEIIADSIVKSCNTSKIILFYGEMGAGKTTLIKKICENLGIVGTTSSPTYSIVNEYIGADIIIYHFDFYRIKNQNEAIEIGCEEYLYSGNYCLIEWPEKIPDLLPKDCKSVKIEVLDAHTRKFHF